MTNLSRHPVLRAIYGASQAIEKCGASRELTDAVMAVTALYAPAEGLLDHIASLERQLEEARAQLAERTRERDEARYILAGSDYGSLPNDWTLPRVAEARMGDINKLTWQVRDTCARAESAEQQARELREALAELLAADYAIKGDIVSDDYYAMALRWSRAKDAARAALAPAQQEKGEQT